MLSAVQFRDYRTGEFYSYNTSYQWGIVTKDQWHPLHSATPGNIVPGELLGFTFDGGRVAATASLESKYGSRLRVDCLSAHGLVDTDLVVLVGMSSTANSLPTHVTQISGTAFSCDDIPYTAGGASTGKVIVPASLRADSGSLGLYSAHCRLNAKAEASAKVWSFILFSDTVEVQGTLDSRETTATIGEIHCNGHVRMVAGQRLWLGGRNETNTTDITVYNLNLEVHKVGE